MPRPGRRHCLQRSELLLPVWEPGCYHGGGGGPRDELLAVRACAEEGRTGCGEEDSRLLFVVDVFLVFSFALFLFTISYVIQRKRVSIFAEKKMKRKREEIERFGERERESRVEVEVEEKKRSITLSILSSLSLLSLLCVASSEIHAGLQASVGSR